MKGWDGLQVSGDQTGNDLFHMFIKVVFIFYLQKSPKIQILQNIAKNLNFAKVAVRSNFVAANCGLRRQKNADDIDRQNYNFFKQLKRAAEKSYLLNI